VPSMKITRHHEDGGIDHIAQPPDIDRGQPSRSLAGRGGESSIPQVRWPEIADIDTPGLG
jgi:hypothetical protein